MAAPRVALATEEAPARTRRARRIVRTLGDTYPDARCELDFTTPLELLVATILSAQCTDKRVNLVTPALFKKYPTAAAFAAADRAELESLPDDFPTWQDLSTTTEQCTGRECPHYADCYVVKARSAAAMAARIASG